MAGFAGQLESQEAAAKETGYAMLGDRTPGHQNWPHASPEPPAGAAGTGGAQGRSCDKGAHRGTQRLTEVFKSAAGAGAREHKKAPGRGRKKAAKGR